jgi:SAM-dependent methyltransferase
MRSLETSNCEAQSYCICDWVGRLLRMILGKGVKVAIDLEHPLKGFDEATYLNHHPDVLDAVKKGNFSSGWEHYVFYGCNENRSGVPSKVRESVLEARKHAAECDSSGTAPPAKLRKRVHGDEDLLNFERAGRVVAANIRDAIAPVFALDDQSRVLDFGCGCGRVLTHLRKLYSQGMFYGSDIDEEAILWCQGHLSRIGQFVVNGQSPPLPFDDEFFDFVFSISVFTHLPEDMQFEWLAELRRVTKPDGCLLLTTHGASVLKKHADAETMGQFEEKGFYYSRGEGTEGLPDFYQTSFHTERYIQKEWGKFFEIEKIIPRGIGSYQDLILCKRRR